MYKNVSSVYESSSESKSAAPFMQMRPYSACSFMLIMSEIKVIECRSVIHIRKVLRLNWRGKHSGAGSPRRAHTEAPPHLSLSGTQTG